MKEIPAPQGLPLLGNTLQIPAHSPAAHFTELADRYEEGLFRLDIVGRKVTFVYDPDMVAEACDETRFKKRIQPPLTIVRDFAGDGLFTADIDTPVWGHAHRILMPAFSQRSMRAYYPQMLEVAEQLVASWAARQGQDLPVSDDMTRLTLDTISLTGFGYRFESFDKPSCTPSCRPWAVRSPRRCCATSGSPWSPDSGAGRRRSTGATSPPCASWSTT